MPASFLNGAWEPGVAHAISACQPHSYFAMTAMGGKRTSLSDHGWEIELFEQGVVAWIPANWIHERISS